MMVKVIRESECFYKDEKIIAFTQPIYNQNLDYIKKNCTDFMYKINNIQHYLVLNKYLSILLLYTFFDLIFQCHSIHKTLRMKGLTHSCSEHPVTMTTCIIDTKSIFLKIFK